MAAENEQTENGKKARAEGTDEARAAGTDEARAESTGEAEAAASSVASSADTPPVTGTAAPPGTPAAATGPKPPTDPPTKSRRSRLKLAALISGILGLLLIGTLIGHLLWPKQVVEVTEVVRPPEAHTGQTPVGMPDLLGLREDIARRAIADAGMTGAITTSTKPAAGPAGLVVSQTPNPGAANGPIALVLSTETMMPKLVGAEVTRARATLREAGAVVLLNRIIAPDKPSGTIVATRPNAGTPLPATVELDVADTGPPLSLTQVRTSDSQRCSTTSDVTVGTTTLAHAVTCQHYTGDAAAAYADYPLNRLTLSFAATVSFAEGTPPGAQATASVMGEGKVLWSQPVIAGKPHQVRLATDKITTLRIQITAATSAPAATVVWGEPSVFGQPDRLAQVPR